MKVIVITGTPASGKTTIAERVAKRIRGAQLIRANDLVKSRHLFTSYASDGAMVTDMRRLKAEVEKEILASKAGVVIVEGHLLCDIPVKGAIAIVIREHLGALEKRMEKRKYGRPKIKENIIAEAIDYCGISSQKNYAHVFEIMNDRNSASKILSIVKKMKGEKKGIELLEELKAFTERKGWNS